MSLATEALITVAQAGAWLKLDAATITADTELLEALILAATKLTEDYCGRKWITQTLTETRVGNGETYLALNWWPVTDVASITMDGTALTSTEWSERLSIGRLYYASSWEAEVEASAVWDLDSEIVIVYTAGYDTDRTVVQGLVPLVVTAVKMLVAELYENREGVQSISIDGVGRTDYRVKDPIWKQLIQPLKVSVL
ncbi:MAG: hypothetical protein BWY79_01227 [Actinobacteria bacterium ADurb.Bin444]|nr:MAG: hypothetical protein BWY79_01227 [Actinobacteria bacterium ADurb.Bin444]